MAQYTKYLNLSKGDKPRICVEMRKLYMSNKKRISEIHKFLKNKDLLGSYTIHALTEQRLSPYSREIIGTTFWFTNEQTAMIFKLRFGVVD